MGILPMALILGRQKKKKSYTDGVAHHSVGGNQLETGFDGKASLPPVQARGSGLL